MNVRTHGRIQPVSATHSLNISAGVWKPSVLRMNSQTLPYGCSGKNQRSRQPSCFSFPIGQPEQGNVLPTDTKT